MVVSRVRSRSETNDDWRLRVDSENLPKLHPQRSSLRRET